MKKDENMLELFEGIDAIGSSAEWDQQLMKRINAKPVTSGGKIMVIVMAAFLFAINALSLTERMRMNKMQQSKNNLKSVASEFLINTSSSNY
jgi:hypothetical protein